MVQFIGHDGGRDGHKAQSGYKQVSVKSAVGKARARNLVEDLNYFVEIDGRKWFVGDLARESFYSRRMASESKIHEDTRVLFLTSLALVAEPGSELVITTGLPVKQHNPATKQKLTELLCGEHIVKINDKEAVRLTIPSIGIVPEGAGAYFNEILDDDGNLVNEWLAKRLTRIIDIGSRTVNLCTIDEQNRYIDRDSDTLMYGIMELENASSGDPAEDDMEEFTRKLVGDINKRWQNYNPVKDIILLSGGGTLKLKQWIKSYFPVSLIARDPIFANASGNRKMGMIRWQKQQTK